MSSVSVPRRLNHRAWCVSVAVLSVLLLLAVTPAALAQGDPRMVFDDQLRVETVCFTVNNQNDPNPSTLYGRRYTDGPVNAQTPVIVLVHGFASSTDNWDFTPTWSVARALASAGYVVYAYDRLGYGRSTYFDRPAGGTRITVPGQRFMLNQVINHIKNATYQTTAGKDCSGAKAPGTLRNQSVAIIGHSLGGLIVAGYPGQYHDVEAMVSTAINGSLSPDEGTDDVPASEGGSFTTTNEEHPDYLEFFQTREDCEAFNVHPPGQVRYAVDVACDPNGFLISPSGDIGSLGQTAEENRRNIRAIGRGTAVLLSSGDHDTTAPPAAQRGDFSYYKANCGCDVTLYSIATSGHLFMVHRSLKPWVDFVVGWLSAKGLPPTLAGSRRPGGRRSPRGITLTVTPRRERRAPFRFRARGRVQLFTGVTPAQACRGGRVALRVRVGRRTVALRRVALRRDCTYRRRVTFRKRARLGRAGRLRFRARFRGNDALGARLGRVRVVRVGRR
jgi:pimeloyl-ACP methyl ester carboxylesterase